MRCGQTTMSSNRPPEEWGKLIGRSIGLHTAILDRFLQKAEVVQITGKSYRLEKSQENFKRTKPPPAPMPKKCKRMSTQFTGIFDQQQKLVPFRRLLTADGPQLRKRILELVRQRTRIRLSTHRTAASR